MDEQSELEQAREEIRKLRRHLSSPLDEAPRDTGGVAHGMCSRRKTAREVLEEERERTVGKLQGIDAMLKALPQEMPLRADEALADLIRQK